jgi:hypothetical protein
MNRESMSEVPVSDEDAADHWRDEVITMIADTLVDMEDVVAETPG